MRGEKLKQQTCVCIVYVYCKYLWAEIDGDNSDNRITANAPYPAAAKAAAAPPKQVKAEAWLGLGPQLPFQIQRN